MEGGLIYEGRETPCRRIINWNRVIQFIILPLLMAIFLFSFHPATSKVEGVKSRPSTIFLQENPSGDVVERNFDPDSSGVKESRRLDADLEKIF